MNTLPNETLIAQTADRPEGPWYRDLNRYHWLVMSVCLLGWLFDCLDQRLFVLSRGRAMEALSQGRDLQWCASIATAWLLIGWATGGLLFGMVADRYGRARTLRLTILWYSCFTGLSALSVAWWDFCFYRFLTGLGAGGVFAAGVALVAEVMPARARPHALGLFQSMSALGNITGSLIGVLVLPMTVEVFGLSIAGWRWMFVVGVLPALLAVWAMRRLKEPAAWLAAKAAIQEDKRQNRPPLELGSWKEMLGTRRWRRNTIIGLLLVTAGAMGLWGVGFWTPELIRKHVLANLSEASQDRIASLALALQDVGGFFGVLFFTWLTSRIGRRRAFAISFLAAWAMCAMVFGLMDQQWQIYWMIPLLGFATMTVFGGYSIYLPELFPTRLRSTGAGFCYNVARYATALGVSTLGSLQLLYASWGFAAPFRWATVSIASFYLLGLVALLYAPETKDQQLPE